jgi:hypothetical protein
VPLPGGGACPPPVSHRREGRRERAVHRLVKLDTLDVLLLGCYIGMTAWGFVAQFEPPITLVGAAGPVIARVVTIGVLVFGLSAIVALLFDQTVDGRTRGDVELPILAALIGAWGTYSTTAWLLVAGLGTPTGAPVLKVFAVLTTVMLVPFLVRFVTLVHGAVQTLRAARRARELGLVDENWNTTPA